MLYALYQHYDFVLRKTVRKMRKLWFSEKQEVVFREAVQFTFIPTMINILLKTINENVMIKEYNHQARKSDENI